MEKQAKVFIGICTGPSKDYAMHYMMAALRNLDWANKEIHWAVTSFDNAESDAYLQRLKQLSGTVKWDCPVYFHITHVNPQKFKYCRVVDSAEGELPTIFPFDLVLTNLRRLRGVFLDGDCDYFLEVGGDNPPHRDTIQQLMSHGKDVVAGLCYQRPREKERITPLVWLYAWQMKDLPMGLAPEVTDQFKTAFTDTPFLIPLGCFDGWQKEKTITPYAGGTGMVLIKRHVLERVGWHMPPSLYFTEDLYFFHQCNIHGYSTLGDLTHHVMHFHDNGMMY